MSGWSLVHWWKQKHYTELGKQAFSQCGVQSECSIFIFCPFFKMNLTKFIWRSLELLLTSQSSLPCCGLGLLALLPAGGPLRRPVTPGRVLADRWACCRSGVVWVEAVEGADLAPFHLWTSLSACSATAYKTQRTSLPLHLLSVQWISTKFTFVFIHFYFTD